MDNKPCEEGKMYTIEDIQKLGPCEEYTKEKLKELWEKKESLSRRDILKLDIPINDKNWVIPRLVSVDTVVKWAQWCATEAKNHAARAARSAYYTDTAAWYADAAARYAATACYAANAADAASYAANAASYAANAAASEYAAAARATADAADATGYAAGYASWSENRDAELYRLLTVLCDMEERCTQ